MRVLVCGGRNFADRLAVFRALDEQAELCESKMLPDPDFVVIHGACPSGADRHADDWAVANWTKTQAFPADWTAHGRAAGPIRNQQMIDKGKPDLILAFPGGRGTADMVSRAQKAGVQVIVVPAAEPKP